MKPFARTVTGSAIVLCLLGNIADKNASADPSISDRTTATQLFKEGRALLEEDHVALACPKLEESQRLDPGGGTLLNVALCHERLGRTASAWAEFTEALGIAKRDDRPQRIEFARSHIAQLESELSRLLIEVPSVADVPDLEIRRDGSVVPRAAWGSAIPVDPGDHVVEASAPGKVQWRLSLSIGTKADLKTVAVPVLDRAPSRPEIPSPVATPRPVAPAAPTARPDDGLSVASSPDRSLFQSAPSDRPSSPSAAPVVIAGVGFVIAAAGAGMGTYLGLHAISLKNDANRNCPNDACNSQGSSQTSNAIVYGNWSTASFGAGIAGAIVGTILLVTRPASRSDHSSSVAAPAAGSPAITSGDVSLGPGGGELTVSGKW